MSRSHSNVNFDNVRRPFSSREIAHNNEFASRADALIVKLEDFNYFLHQGSPRHRELIESVDALLASLRSSRQPPSRRPPGLSHDRPHDVDSLADLLREYFR